MNYKNLLFFNKSGHQSNLVWNGDFWEARLMLPKVSTDLFEVEHLFIVETFKNGNGETVYGYPHITPDTSSSASASGIYGGFTAGSNTVDTDVSPLLEFVGSSLFTSQFPNGNKIISIDVDNKKIELENPASYSDTNVPLIFNIWRSSFETTRNILDFDTFDSFKGSVVAGNDYITTTADVTALKSNNDYLHILGDGIPKDCRIIKVETGKIYLNKVCNVNVPDTTVFVYPVEERNDVSDYIYQYELIEDLDLDNPVLNKLEKAYFKIDFDPNESIVNNQRITDSIESSSISVNLALISPEEGIFGRTLVIEDLSLGYPKIIARIEIHGETVGEDERYQTLLSNFGRRLNSEDAFILRDSDPEEPLTDKQLLNLKRKELLLEGHEIYPYLGSYKGLINAIRFFGYYDLRIKEYWLNVKKSDTQVSAIKENSTFISKLKSSTKDQTTLIGNLLDDENSGKYKQVEVYGKRDDGTYGLKSQLTQIYPSSTYKKTALFGLFYDINEVVPDTYDEFDYPVVKDSFVFSPEEVLMKLFALREKLKKDFLPLNARIIDITGEGVYFTIYKTRGWVDNLKIDELNQGLDISVEFTPDYGYIEDLRPFQNRLTNELPYVPYVGPDPLTFQFNTYGNTVMPSALNPQLKGSDSKKLADAIKAFYVERNTQNVGIYRLGDGDTKNGGYFRHVDGKKNEVPAGFPTVLEITSFNLSWDEVNSRWENLDRNISTYQTQTASTSDIQNYTGDNFVASSFSLRFDLGTIFGNLFDVTLPAGLDILNPSNGKVQVKFTSSLDSDYQFLCQVNSYNITTGDSVLKLLWSKNEGVIDLWDVEVVNIFEKNLDLEYYDYSFNADGYYSWDNIRFGGFYEIEWTVTKKDYIPFNFEFRGRISDYYKLPIVLPYAGIYSVKCRVWNGFNDICTAYYNESIEVKNREIELTNVARFREAEVYTWENSTSHWDNYQSAWVFPVERPLYQPTASAEVLNYSNYGNQYNEGQECKVLKKFPETQAEATIKVGLKRMVFSAFTSTYGTSGRGPALVTINPSYLPHNLASGEYVTLFDNHNTGSGNLSGSYKIFNVTSTGFTLPFILDSSVDPTKFSIVKEGSLKISYGGKTLARSEFYNDLSTTLNNFRAAVNNSTKLPKFKIKDIQPTTVTSALVQDWFEITFEAPLDSGATLNGTTLDFIGTEEIYLYDGYTVSQSSNAVLVGGVNPYSDYVDYSFDGEIPVDNIRYYGTKKMDWDSFEALEWDNIYAQTWGMYDYHFDWLGGFNLYNLQSGDQLKVGRNTQGIVLGDRTSPDPSANYLDLYEAAEQLNASKDPGISKFYYEVRGYSKLPSDFKISGSPINPPLTAVSLPHNEETEEYDITNGTSIVCEPYGEIIIGTTTGVKIFKSPTDIEYYPIHTLYPGSSTRKVQTDEYGNWWCYGDSCSVPLLVYDRHYPENTKVVTTQISGLVIDPSLNLILPLNVTDFQVISLAVDNLSGDFCMFIKYAQTYSARALEYGFKLVRYNASSKEFEDISTEGPVWNVSYQYDLGSVSTYLGASYKSLKNNNTGKTPGSFSDYWEKIENGTLGLIDATIDSVRQMKYEYDGKKSKLWIATNNGVKIYDGIKIQTLTNANSGINRNDSYCVTFDEVGGKWIGTDQGISYFDNGRWGVWTPTTNPELPVGKYRNIVNIGNGRIFFMVQTGTATYKLVYFNGLTFKVYDSNPGTTLPFSPGSSLDYDYEDIYMFINKIKTIDGNFTRYPEDLFYLGGTVRNGIPYVVPGYWDPTYVGVFYQGAGSLLRKSTYLVPHIHASSKNSGMPGWDFVYHLSHRPFADPIYVRNKGLGDTLVNFNFIVGPLYSAVINIGKDPQLPFVDSKTWKMPSWIKYDFNDVINSHPSLDADDLFLDAPLRDILSGKASREEYWKNSSAIRSADRDRGNIIDDFEWVIKIGDSYDDKGVKTFIDKEGFIYVTGYFKGDIYFGAKNNLPSGVNTTLSSSNCQSIFVAKYNKFGVVQWARMYGESTQYPSTYDYDFTPTGIKVDGYGNVILIGYKEKNRNNTTGELPSSFYVKWDWNAQISVISNLFTINSLNTSEVVKEIVIDRVGNIYVAGTFNGTLTSSTSEISTGLLDEIFVSRIESDGYVKWIKSVGSNHYESNPSLEMGRSFEDLYLAYNSNSGSEQKIILGKYSSYDFVNEWTKEIINLNYNSVDTEPHIKISSLGDIALGATFAGSLSVDGLMVESEGVTDIALIKFSGLKATWMKSVGSSNSDYCHDVQIDSEGNIYTLGSYGAKLKASPEYVSPSYYDAPKGDLDVIMFKYSGDGRLLDIVNSGGLARDEGISLSLDDEENMYITGYVSGSSQFSNWTTSPSGGTDAFIGKISNLKYKVGNKIGSVYSWFGSGAWSAGDGKIFKSEFEVPIGTTVVFNPIDSLIPGKKNHVWKLIKDESGEEIIGIKDAQSFIWTFYETGFYTLYLEVEDTNGNKSIHSKKGYVRVVDHKKPAPGEIVTLVNSDTFRKRSIYEPDAHPQLG